MTRAKTERGKEALVSCASNPVLSVTHVTTHQVDLPLQCFPSYLELGEAIGFHTSCLLHCCRTLYAIIVNKQKQQHCSMSTFTQIYSNSYWQIFTPGKRVRSASSGSAV